VRVAIGKWKRAAVLGEQNGAGVVAVGGDDGIAQVVLPPPRDRTQPALDLFGIHGRGGGATGEHEHVDPGQRRGGDRRVDFGSGAAVGVEQRVANMVDHRGREAVTRHVDEARHEPPVVVAPGEEPHLFPLSQIRDADGDVV
jgi:hypothetical protein